MQNLNDLLVLVIELDLATIPDLPEVSDTIPITLCCGNSVAMLSEPIFKLYADTLGFNGLKESPVTPPPLFVPSVKPIAFPLP